MSGWEDGQEVVFLVGDYPDEHNCSCLVRFLSSRTIDLALSALRIAEWWQRWHDVEDEDDPNWAIAREYITTAEHELMADCSGLGEAIQSGLEAIAAALQTSGGGGGCGTGQSTVLNCLSGYTEDEILGEPAEGIDPNGETPPAGFDTMAEYLDYKCKIAHAVVDDAVHFFRTLKGLTGAAATMSVVTPIVIAALVGSGAVAFPPADVVALAVVVLTILAASAVGFQVADTIGDAIEANRTDIVCSLYNSSNTVQAIAALTASIEDAIQAVEWSTIFGPALGAQLSGLYGTLAAHLENNGLVNSLFRLIADFSYPAVDCESCAENLIEWHFDFGTEGWYYTDNAELPAETVGEWSPEEPIDDGDSSPGHLHTHENAQAAGVWEYWIYDYDTPPTVTAAASVSFDICRNEETGPQRVQFHVMFTDETSAVYNDDQAATPGEYETHTFNFASGNIGKQIEQIYVLVYCWSYGGGETWELDKVVLTL